MYADTVLPFKGSMSLKPRNSVYIGYTDNATKPINISCQIDDYVVLGTHPGNSGASFTRQQYVTGATYVAYVAANHQYGTGLTVYKATDTTVKFSPPYTSGYSFEAHVYYIE